jgi:hypothetical protein
MAVVGCFKCEAVHTNAQQGQTVDAFVNEPREAPGAGFYQAHMEGGQCHGLR